MQTEAALAEHARSRDQCEVRPHSWRLRSIPRDVIDKLKERKKPFRGQSDEDTWRYIYGLLFPDSAPIANPCKLARMNICMSDDNPLSDIVH